MKLGKKTNDTPFDQCHDFQTCCHNLGTGQPTSAVPMGGATLQESVHTARLQQMHELKLACKPLREYRSAHGLHESVTKASCQ